MMQNKLKKIKLKHYINYIVLGIMTAVFAIVTLTGGRFDSSLIYLLEKIAISMPMIPAIVKRIERPN